MRFNTILVLLVASGVVVGGCTPTIRSSRDSAFNTSQPGGVTYFLPMRLMKVTMTRAPVTLDRLIAERDAKVVELAATSATATAARSTRDQAIAVLAALAPTATSRADQVKVVERTTAEEVVLAARVASQTAEVNALKEAIRISQTTGDNCLYSAKLELMPPQADRNARFVATMPHNILRDETINIVVTPGGLLTSANVTATDQTGQILTQIAGLLGSFTGASRGGAEPPEGCEGPPSLMRQFDPMSTTDLASVNNELDAADFPFRIRVPNDQRGGGMGADAADGYLPRAGVSGPGFFYRTAAPVSVRLVRLWDPPTPSTVPEGDTTNADAQPDLNGDEPSVAETVPASDFAVREVTIDEQPTPLPQAGPVSYLPMPASPFVTTTNNVQFVDGALISQALQRPSEVKAGVDSAANAVTAFFKALGDLLTLRIAISNNYQSLDTRLTGESAQAAINRLTRICVEKAEAAGEDPGQCTATLEPDA
ncbi:MAG: hypothetical protein Q8M90_06595 [Brevundimonas sp.]|nr:hypothetical protein [Brevundimonas sp.]MDZ4062801.1 hypothetical protein [Brevundimonas sp.]